MKQLRSTPQRRLVLSLLEGNYSHPTADEVYEMARVKEPRISRATVYRNLNLLADNDEIGRIPMPSGPIHFDCDAKHHYHFLCRKCLKVVDTDLPYYEALNNASASLPGYTTEWHSIVLVGLCPECEP
ncbi:MAG: transcriptional repressor [Clostridia bacterium]